MTIMGTDTVQTPRIDTVPKVTGQAVYTEDLSLPPGALYGAILRSPGNPRLGRQFEKLEILRKLCFQRSKPRRGWRCGGMLHIPVP